MMGVTTWRENGVCNGKHGAKADGCEGAVRPSEAAFRGISGPLERDDMPTGHGSCGSVDQYLEASLVGLQGSTGPRRVGGNGGPGWPIGLIANCSRGEYMERGLRAEADIPGHSATESTSFRGTRAGLL